MVDFLLNRNMNYEFQYCKYTLFSIVLMKMKRISKMKTISFRYLALSLLLAFSPKNSFTWGSEGHDVIVRMAIRLMPPAERKAVYALLGTHDTYIIGNWADEIKAKNGTGPWHYVDIPDRNTRYNAGRDCPNDNCIIAKLEMVQAQVRNHSLNRRARRTALLYWFHLIGDLYQPFHCYGDKNGGNDITVYFKNQPTNLHKLWDEKIIRYKNPSPWKLASDIFNASHRVPALSTTVVDVAEQSHARAVSMKLRNNTTVTADYVQRSWSMIQTCLWQAACMASTIGPDV